MKNFFILVVMNLIYFSSQGLTCADIENKGIISINDQNIEIIVYDQPNTHQWQKNPKIFKHDYESAFIKINGVEYQLESCFKEDNNQLGNLKYIRNINGRRAAKTLSF